MNSLPDMQHENSNNMSDEDNPQPSTSLISIKTDIIEQAISTKRKVGRPRKIVDPNTISNVANATPDGQIKKRGRGRPRKPLIVDISPNTSILNDGQTQCERLKYNLQGATSTTTTEDGIINENYHSKLPNIKILEKYGEFTQSNTIEQNNGNTEEEFITSDVTHENYTNSAPNEKILVKQESITSNTSQNTENNSEYMTLSHNPTFPANSSEPQNVYPSTSQTFEDNYEISQNYIPPEPSRKRGRPKKIQQQSPLNLSSDESFKIPKKRGRPRKSETNNSYCEGMYETGIFSEISDYSLNDEVDLNDTIVKTEPIDPLEQNEEPQNLVKLAKCMTCNLEMEPKMWAYHNLFNHNNLSWRQGDPPIDVNDDKLVLRIYTNIVKAKKMLKCTKCGAKKKSALGFISHTQQCQLSKEERDALRIPCEICGRLYAPISIKVHMTQAHSEKPTVSNLPRIIEPEELPAKRYAAQKAVNMIQEFSGNDITSPVERSIRKCYKAPGDTGNVYSVGLMKYYKKTLKLSSEICCKIKQCEFKCKDMDIMKEHLTHCPQLTPYDYICKYCLHVTQSEDLIISHASALHSGNDDREVCREETEDDEEDERYVKIRKGKDKNSEVQPRASNIRGGAGTGLVFYDQDKQKLSGEHTFNKMTYKWTLELIQKYHKSNLFNDQKCLPINWKKLKQEEINLYEPTQSLSPFVSQVFMQKSIPSIQAFDHQWKRYKLYASSTTNDTATIYCGGQIYAMAWAPIPVTLYSDQILAVSVQRKYNQNYMIGKIYQTRHVIQFWDFGKLSNNNPITEKPRLSFCLATDHGVAWSMVWCPSGCYDSVKSEDSSEMKRLGLLAMACSDGNVVIYSICHPEALGRSLKLRYYKPKPVFVLQIHSISDQKYEEESWHYQATRVSWSKSNGHNVIAGGFSNGTVCIWDLHCTSPLLRSEQNGKIYLKPSQCFQPHGHVISALDFHITGNGRYLLTGSWDKTSKFWDLTNTSCPITVHKKGLVTDGLWMNNWISAFTTYEDTFILGHCNSTVQTVRDYMYKMNAMIATNSIVNNCSVNDWLNSLAQCNLAGELTACFPKQLLFNFDHDRSSRYRKMMISYCELIEKNLSPEERAEKQKKKKNKKADIDISEKDDAFLLKYCAERDSEAENYIPEPSTYENAVNRYGLVFCDLQIDSLKNQPEDMRRWFRQSINMHEPNVICPLNSINRCAWNPNYQSFMYIASGLDAGFLRLHCLRFLKTEGECGM